MTDTLNDLAAVTDEHGVAMSAYIDLNPADTGTQGELAERGNALVDELRRFHPGDDSHEAKLRFEQTLERISGRLLAADLETSLPAGRKRAVAVFAWGTDGLQELSFRAGSPDHAIVGPRLSLTAAAARSSLGDDTLVLVASREAGNLYRYHRGALSEVFDDSQRVQPDRDPDQADEAHQKALATHLEKVFERLGRPPVVIAADPNTTGLLQKHFGPELSAAVIDLEKNEANWTSENIIDEAERSLAERDRRHQAALLERWQSQSGHADHPQHLDETLSAASDGRIEWLLLAQGAEPVVFSCPTCKRLYPGSGTCPLDGAWLEADQHADALVAEVLKNGGAVWELLESDDASLAGTDGVAGIYRY